jgi:hypothetical protein
MSLGNVTISAEQLERIMFDKPTPKMAWEWNGNTFPTREQALKSEFKSKLGELGFGSGTRDNIIEKFDDLHKLFHEYTDILADDGHPASTVTAYAGCGGGSAGDVPSYAGGNYSDGSSVRNVQSEEWKW